MLRATRVSAVETGGAEPVTPATGAALRFIAAAIGARAVVEIGTGCGTSGIWLLRGMADGGVLTSVDSEPEHQRLARRAFGEAGFASGRYRLISGRALEVLPRLADGAYDIVFCDADRQEYPDYLIAALRLLRPGGVVAFDDALWRGRVTDDLWRERTTVRIHRSSSCSMRTNPLARSGWAPTPTSFAVSAPGRSRRCRVTYVRLIVSCSCRGCW